MAELSKEDQAAIDAQIKVEEMQILVGLLFESTDENVKAALSQALAVVKMVHSDEVEEEIVTLRADLTAQAICDKEEQVRGIQRRLRQIQEVKKKDKDRSVYDELIDVYWKPEPMDYEQIWKRMKYDLEKERSITKSSYEDWYTNSTQLVKPLESKPRKYGK